jgi:hypothetical protein
MRTAPAQWPRLEKAKKLTKFPLFLVRMLPPMFFTGFCRDNLKTCAEADLSEDNGIIVSTVKIGRIGKVQQNMELSRVQNQKTDRILET